MNDFPLFSILIANFNNGRFLQQAIDSVLEQTYPNWEVIIVDDKSTDNSYDIYEKYKDDQRFHFYFNNKNMGCAFTKHQCVLHANGVYCGYLDPDDALLPNALTVSYNQLSTNPTAVLSFSRFFICDENLNIIKESRPLVLKPDESYFEHKDYRAEVFAGFVREAYFKMGGIDTTNRAGVDADLYFRLEEVGNLVISHEITYKYRIFSSSITGNWDRAFYWNMIIRHNTCMRRGLPVEKYSYADFLTHISFSHWETRPYRLGKLITNPISWFKYKKRQREIKKQKLL